MYCAICKKWMDSDDLVCPECEALLRQRQTPPPPPPPQPTPVELQPPVYTPAPTPPATPIRTSYHPDPLNRMFGFGKALTATILGFVGFITALVGLEMCLLYEMTSGVVALLMALPCFIIALILGIQSIRCFKERKDSCAKNIPTLILGIAGVALAGLTALYLLLLFFLLAALA